MSPNYCLSCGYAGLTKKPYKNLPESPDIECTFLPYENTWGEASGETCSCCGYTFGFDDRSELRAGKTFREYLENWIRAGAVWVHEEKKPLVFDLERQLKIAGLKIPFSAKQQRRFQVVRTALSL